jgi:hypothetical protein
MNVYNYIVQEMFKLTDITQDELDELIDIWCDKKIKELQIANLKI